MWRIDHFFLSLASILFATTLPSGVQAFQNTAAKQGDTEDE